MLSEKVLFSLNNVSDSFLEETRELLSRSVTSRRFSQKKAVRVFLIAAVLAALMAATAYAIASIHQQRQQELKTDLKIEENSVDSYMEYEVPLQDSTSGVTLLSTLNDGEFQRVFVNVSPVEKNVINRYPKTIGFAWKLDGMALNGEEYWMTAKLRIKADPSASSEEEIREAVINEAYDEATKTVTLECDISKTAISQALAYENNERVHLTLTLWDHQAQADANVGLSAEWLSSQESFGSVWFTPTEREVRYFDFNHVLYNEELDKSIEIVGLELSPFSAVWKLKYEGAAEFHKRDTDWDAFKSWAMLEDQIGIEAKLIFRDGSNFSTGGAQTSIFEDGVVKLNCDWQTAINIDDVQRIVLGDLVLWEAE